MTTVEEPLLDEIQWRSSPIAQNMGGIHTNTVLPYFYESPYFDRTSNNAILSSQAQYNPSMIHIVATREAFESRLRTMAGLEFMVTHDPSDGGRNVQNSGVWVVRKQVRRKRPGLEDEIAPLSAYFVVGESVYMAPSVGNILGGRLLSTVTALTKFLATASALPVFTPSLGYAYLPPVAKPVSTATSSLQATQTSKDSSPLPDTQLSLRSTKASQLSDAPSTVPDVRASSLLADSFLLSTTYGAEYMDENPLVGEPGSFILQKSRDAAAQAQVAGKGAGVVKPAVVAAGATPTPAQAPIPPPIKTEGLPLEVRRGKAGEKTPVTPGTAGKKRKKSRVAGVGVGGGGGEK
ncbi:Mediator of RNA polymerase II transcription subunit 6 [Xylographa opegraphella]|nr:Mediator of RNA polymerase II transcription subunit 6 [Xylographa opegraphella]